MGGGGGGSSRRKVPSAAATRARTRVRTLALIKTAELVLLNAIRSRSQLIYLFDDKRRWRESDGALRGGRPPAVISPGERV